MSDFWMTENHTEGYRVQWKIKDILHSENTIYQNLSVVETVEWGKALILDGAVQITESDEFIYHEMIVHPVMYIHPHPSSVLIIGGGDGGTLREVVKHDTVTNVDMVEIDERVVANSRLFFPQVACSFDDPRLKLHIADGIEYVKETKKCYDVVIVDSSDPVGPAMELFSEDFYRHIFKILNDNGILVVQSESPVFFKDSFLQVNRNMKRVFPEVGVYLTTCPSYVAGPWSFTMGSKKFPPEQFSTGKHCINDLKYYNEGVHKAAFYLPEFIKDMLAEAQ